MLFAEGRGKPEEERPSALWLTDFPGRPVGEERVGRESKAAFGEPGHCAPSSWVALYRPEVERSS